MQSLERPAAAAADERVRGAGAHVVLRTLLAWGIDLVFTCPGSTEAAFLDASLQYPDLRLVLVTHESIALAAADGYARATGRPAVAYLHTNVGLANAVAHLHCAQLARSPVVILNGMKATPIQNRGGFTTVPHPRDYVRQHVVLDRVALSPEAIGDDLVRALKAATAEPGGPVYLGLPQDLMEAEGPLAIPDVARHRVDGRRRPAPEAVAAAARALTAGRKVVVVAGSEVAASGAQGELLALAERLDAPILLEDRRTLETCGVPPNGPRFAGFYGPRHPAVRAADVIFLAGMGTISEFDPPREPTVPTAATILHLCSDPGEIAKVDPADVALVGDARLALVDLLAALPGEAAGRAERGAFCVETTAAYREGARELHAKAAARAAQKPIAVSALMHALDELLEPDALVVGDATTSGTALLNLVVAGSRRTYIKSSGGSLGWGVGAALGVQLAAPDRRVVCVCGDGVFQFGIQALWTAAALPLPITFVVIDNASYGAVKAALKRYRHGAQEGPFPGTDLRGPDYATIGSGFGARSFRVGELGELRAALEQARAHDGPSLICVRTDPADTGPP